MTMASTEQSCPQQKLIKYKLNNFYDTFTQQMFTINLTQKDILYI